MVVPEFFILLNTGDELPQVGIRAAQRCKEGHGFRLIFCRTGPHVRVVQIHGADEGDGFCGSFSLQNLCRAVQQCGIGQTPLCFGFLSQIFQKIHFIEPECGGIVPLVVEKFPVCGGDIDRLPAQFSQFVVERDIAQPQIVIKIHPGEDHGGEGVGCGLRTGKIVAEDRILRRQRVQIRRGV